MKKLLKNNGSAVSEIVGTILMLAISVGLMSAVYVSVFSVMETPQEHVNVCFLGSRNGENIVFEHYGGEGVPASLSTIIVNGTEVNMLPFLRDKNDDGCWSLGEAIVMQAPEETLKIQIVCNDQLIFIGDI